MHAHPRHPGVRAQARAQASARIPSRPHLSWLSSRGRAPLRWAGWIGSVDDRLDDRAPPPLLAAESRLTMVPPTARLVFGPHAASLVKAVLIQQGPYYRTLRMCSQGDVEEGVGGDDGNEECLALPSLPLPSLVSNSVILPKLWNRLAFCHGPFLDARCRPKHGAESSRTDRFVEFPAAFETGRAVAALGSLPLSCQAGLPSRT